MKDPMDGWEPESNRDRLLLYTGMAHGAFTGIYQAFMDGEPGHAEYLTIYWRDRFKELGEDLVRPAPLGEEE